MESLLIAGSSFQFGQIKYQPVYRQECTQIHLNSVNILTDNTICVKIKAEDTSIEFLVENAEKIAVDYLIGKLNKKPSAKKTTRKEARVQAANDLMKQFNL